MACIRVFAELTNHDDRWGSDGLSGILELVSEDDFWYKFSSSAGEEEETQENYDGKKERDVKIIARVCTGRLVVDITAYRPQTPQHSAGTLEEVPQEPAIDLLSLNS